MSKINKIITMLLLAAAANVKGLSEQIEIRLNSEAITPAYYMPDRSIHLLKRLLGQSGGLNGLRKHLGNCIVDVGWRVCRKKPARR